MRRDPDDTIGPLSKDPGGTIGQEKNSIDHQYGL